MNLYAIQTEIATLVEAILDGAGDTAEAQAALDEMLAGLDEELEAKADDYAALIQSLRSRADARAEEAKRMRDLAAADEALADRLKQRLKDAMEATGKAKIETPRFRLSVQSNGGAQPLEVAVPPEQLPPQYQAVRVEADKAALREALTAGATIPGVTLLPRGTSLRIR
jgi:peptidoglycan hydrolase CwlO-like protein